MDAGNFQALTFPSRIGARLEAVRQQLLSCGHVMANLVEPQSKPLVTDALTKLSQLSCRIAIVGQIKSGKSTFINAFVGQPNLLPTSVTPWTTAITNLNFRQPAPDGCAVHFKFMQKGEWDEIAQGRGELRELTERLVPDFEPELLRRQASAFALRAKERLGDEFDRLLGHSHVFEAIGPGLLENYVCSGELTGLKSIGRYSDITSSADLYFQNGPFEFPITVTDTPGVNDPFLIRDEITRRSLGTADVYIAVLSARQPLSDQDVALLRVMRGLNKDRIVVLINRIDELSNVEEELPLVTTYVRDRLADEFPGSSIPVVYGSSWWATQAHVYNLEAINRLLRRPSAPYLFRMGLIRSKDIEPSALANPETRARISQALHAMSGMPAVYEAVEKVINAAQPTFSLRHISRRFVDMSLACESAAKSELQIMLATKANGGAPAATVSIYTKERDLLLQVAANIEASARAIETQLFHVIEEEEKRLRNTLMATVEAHAARERDVLIDALSRGSSPRVWTHEGVGLRRALANDWNRDFQASASRLAAFHERVIPELHNIMQALVPVPELSTPQSNRLTIPTPANIPLSRVQVLDLDHSRWTAFWNRSASVEAAGAKIESLIRAEFTKVTDELVQSASRTFREIGNETIRWSLGTCRNIQIALQRRMTLLLSEAERQGVPSNAPSEADARIKAQAQRLKDNETLTQHLGHLAGEIDRIAGLRT